MPPSSAWTENPVQIFCRSCESHLLYAPLVSAAPVLIGRDAATSSASSNLGRRTMFCRWGARQWLAVAGVKRCMHPGGALHGLVTALKSENERIIVRPAAALAVMGRGGFSFARAVTRRGFAQHTRRHATFLRVVEKRCC
jgi:hypothetical protein